MDYVNFKKWQKAVEIVVIIVENIRLLGVWPQVSNLWPQGSKKLSYKYSILSSYSR